MYEPEEVKIAPEVEKLPRSSYITIRVRLHPDLYERWKNYLKKKGYYHYGGNTQCIKALIEASMKEEGI